MAGTSSALPGGGRCGEHGCFDRRQSDTAGPRLRGPIGRSRQMAMAARHLANPALDRLDSGLAGSFGPRERRAAASEEILRLADVGGGVFRSPHAAPDSCSHAGMGGRGDTIRAVGFRTVRAHVPDHSAIFLLRLRQRHSHYRLRGSLDDVQRAAHDDAADRGRDAAVLY